MIKKRILLSVMGMSPQIITETLYALAVANPVPWIPQSIHLITTVTAANDARLSLLHPKTGKLHALCEEYGLPPYKEEDVILHIIKDEKGQPLEDIRTPQHNTLMADCITQIVRQLSADEGMEMHVSIAGGRKTMGFYLGYALSLYGRSQDKLSHVLVSKDYESLRDFFYPTANSQVIYDRAEKPLDASLAEVWLADIPFVRLRDGLSEHLLKKAYSHSDIIQDVQEYHDKPPYLHLCLGEAYIEAGSKKIELPPVELAMLSWFARRKKDDRAALRAPSDGVENKAYTEEYLKEYEACKGCRETMALKNKVGENVGMDKAFFEQTKSKLHKHLKEYMPKAYSHYALKQTKRGEGFALTLPKSAIAWSDF